MTRLLSRARGFRGAAVLLLVTLLAVGLPRTMAAFSGTTASTGTFATASLAAPTGIGTSRPCPAASPSMKGITVKQSSSGTSMSVNTPSATTGDVLIAWMTTSTTSNITGPTSWQTIGQGAGTGYTLIGWYTPLSGAPAASYSFSWASGSAVVVMMSYTNVDPYNPFASVGSSLNTGTTATSATTTVSKAPGRVVMAASVQTAPTMSDPSGSTQRAANATIDGVAGLYAWDAVVNSTGTTPAYTSTWTGSQKWVMLAGYVQPPASPAKDPTVTITWTPAAAPVSGYYLSRNDGVNTSISGQATNSYVDSTTSGSTTYTYTLKSTAGVWTSTGSVTSGTVAIC